MGFSLNQYLFSPRYWKPTSQFSMMFQYFPWHGARTFGTKFCASNSDMKTSQNIYFNSTFSEVSYSQLFSCFFLLFLCLVKINVDKPNKMWKIYISGLIHLLTNRYAAISMIYSYYYPAWIKSSFCQHLSLFISSLKMKMSWG